MMAHNWSTPKDFRRAAWLIACMLLGVCLGVPSVCYSDVVRYRGRGREKPTSISGEIVSYTGTELRIRRPNGLEQTLDSQRVVGIETNWAEAVVTGDEQWQRRDYRSALAAYRKGLKSENRVWAQRQVIEKLIWCLRYEQRHREAGDLFLALYRSDPSTQYFPVIPLAWTTSQPEGELQQRAEAWLADESAVARVMGASRLLPTAKRGQALRILETFDDPDARLVYLARAQIWRTQLARATVADVDAWLSSVEQMPDPIRAGPYFLIATAQARLQLSEDAALSFLRLPILYPKHRDLSARSLFKAAEQLESLGQSKSAQPLYLEVVRDHSKHAYAQQSRRRLEELEAVR